MASKGAAVRNGKISALSRPLIIAARRLANYQSMTTFPEFPDFIASKPEM